MPLVFKSSQINFTESESPKSHTWFYMNSITRGGHEFRPSYQCVKRAIKCMLYECKDSSQISITCNGVLSYCIMKCQCRFFTLLVKHQICKWRKTKVMVKNEGEFSNGSFCPFFSLRKKQETFHNAFHLFPLLVWALNHERERCLSLFLTEIHVYLLVRDVLTRTFFCHFGQNPLFNVFYLIAMNGTANLASSIPI